MTNKPRNRIVVFRLSQDEYRSLKEACERAGARNLSDYTRKEVLERLSSDASGGRLGRRFASLERQIGVVQVQLNNLRPRNSGVRFSKLIRDSTVGFPK